MDIITRKEARELGLKIYFDGTECKRGHISDKFVSSGRCCECVEEDNEIIVEQKEHQVAMRKQQSEKAKEALVFIRQTMNDLDEAEKLQFRTNVTNGTDELDIFPRSRDAAKRLGEDFYDTGLPCKRNHLSKRYTETGQCVACRNQLKEEYKPYTKIYAHERRARFKDAEGFFSKSDIDILFLSQNGLCKYCRVDLKEHGYHIDHRIPLVKGGTNWPENLQLLCPRCNLKKKDKMPEQYEKEIGYKDE